MRARLALRSGANSQAVIFAREALASAQSEHREDPVRTRYLIADAYRLLGDACQQNGDRDGANRAWSAALASLPQGIVEQAHEVDTHARILERLGRIPEAKQMSVRLAAMGYHSNY